MNVAQVILDQRMNLLTFPSYARPGGRAATAEAVRVLRGAGLGHQRLSGQDRICSRRSGTRRPRVIRVRHADRSRHVIPPH